MRCLFARHSAALLTPLGCQQLSRYPLLPRVTSSGLDLVPWGLQLSPPSASLPSFPTSIPQHRELQVNPMATSALGIISGRPLPLAVIGQSPQVLFIYGFLLWLYSQRGVRNEGRKPARVRVSVRVQVVVYQASAHPMQGKSLTTESLSVGFLESV